MRWKIDYYNEDVEKAVLGLPDTLLARYIRLTEVMQNSGPNLGMPHTRAMKDGLFELRLKGKEGIARVFYCTIVKNTVLMLHAFVKKTDKTPDKELKIARNRLLEAK
jgi:phage-related protein